MTSLYGRTRFTCLHEGKLSLLLFGMLLGVLVANNAARVKATDEECESIDQEPRLMGILKKRFVSLTKVWNSKPEQFCLYDLKPNSFDSEAHKLYLSGGTLVPQEWIDKIYSSEKYQCQIGVAVQDSLNGGLYFVRRKYSNVDDDKTAAYVYNFEGDNLIEVKARVMLSWEMTKVSGAISTTEPMKLYTHLFTDTRTQRPELAAHMFTGSEIVTGITGVNQTMPPDSNKNYYICPAGDDKHVYVNESCNSPAWQLLAGFTDQKNFYAFTSGEVYVFPFTVVTSQFGKLTEYQTIDLDDFFVLGDPPLTPVPVPHKSTQKTSNSSVTAVTAHRGNGTDAQPLASDARVAANAFPIIPVVAVVVVIVIFVILAIVAYCCCFSNSDGKNGGDEGNIGGSGGGTSSKASAKNKSKKSSPKPSSKSHKSKSKKAMSGKSKGMSKSAKSKPVSGSKPASSKPASAKLSSKKNSKKKSVKANIVAACSGKKKPPSLKLSSKKAKSVKSAKVSTKKVKSTKLASFKKSISSKQPKSIKKSLNSKKPKSGKISTKVTSSKRKSVKKG